MSLPTLRTAARRAIAGPSSVRALSTSAPVLNQKKKKAPKQNVLHSPDAMPLAEAVRILRALEIANPASAYTLEMVTKMTKGGAPLRGRVALPTDPRRVSDVIVVFASPDSPAAQIAREAGAHHVGEQDLFDKILKEEIKPTKVLSTPAAIPAASKALARFLGPKGLMPAAKRGTVVDGAEIGRLIKEIGGTVDWKSDKFGIIRSPVARMHFSLPMVEENVRALLASVKESSASANDDLLTRGKSNSGILRTRIDTTNGPSIEINDLAH